MGEFLNISVQLSDLEWWEDIDYRSTAFAYHYWIVGLCFKFHLPTLANLNPECDLARMTNWSRIHNYRNFFEQSIMYSRKADKLQISFPSRTNRDRFVARWLK